MIGTYIGSIRLETLLGEGGMATVHLGFDEKLERRVAVKTLHSQRRLGPEGRARFLREARLLSRLEHPHICRVYDLVDGEASDHLVLEYIDGRTLREALDGPDDIDVLRIAEEVAGALGAAHRESGRRTRPLLAWAVRSRCQVNANRCH
ncbi:MAG: protein kinase [Thermoanaerobaculales bacterium]|nr:protein kinase [Thermoanaerobaculales bacterium]